MSYTVKSENPPRRTKWQEKIEEEMASAAAELKTIRADFH